ncbi:vacuolar amino acid permease [Vararia minispora EC-137]|uniref:Vacuolar amino acid permease n=1 Tax=Vararia minispora EC-137 TaxID=1314806 RepID=A0ACB8QBC9_9AGAM|nr:vacuolar amino acid permease [Vararia minispora EC-137]
MAFQSTSTATSITSTTIRHNMTASMPTTERTPLLEGVKVGQMTTDAVELACSKKARQGPREILRSTRYGILAGIWAATFLSSLNMTLVATLLPSISSEFQKSNQASWLGTAYLLATCTFTPLYGRLCNVMGRRGANQAAVLFAALGTLACGLSRDMNTLIIARFIGGLGGGGIFTTATIITSDLYSLRSRGLTQGIASVFNGLGMGLGGPLGGFISDRLGWRWAFLLQMPLFVISLTLTSINLHYVTPGKSKSTMDVLRRIDYGGSLALLGSVLSFLFFLSNRYNSGRESAIFQIDDPTVIVPLVVAGVLFLTFVVWELYIAAEPMLAPFLLKQKIPVVVGISNFLVAHCNFAVTYFFPMWFQTVMLTSASEAGLHLLPNCVSMSVGSMFAGWVMHRTGKYKMLNLIFGLFPFIATVLITRMRPDSGPITLWFSIIPLGFGNAVVLQTMLIALLAHIPPDAMAVGTGFGQLFRGIGQVAGVGVASAIFQYFLDNELKQRFTDPGSDEASIVAVILIARIRHSAKLVATLPLDQQAEARASYQIALHTVFAVASASTLLAYLVRLLIPEKDLNEPPAAEAAGIQSASSESGAEPTASSSTSTVIGPSPSETPFDSDDDEVAPVLQKRRSARRLSTFTSSDGGMDLENDRTGGSARR